MQRRHGSREGCCIGPLCKPCCNDRPAGCTYWVECVTSYSSGTPSVSIARRVSRGVPTTIHPVSTVHWIRLHVQESIGLLHPVWVDGGFPLDPNRCLSVCRCYPYHSRLSRYSSRPGGQRLAAWMLLDVSRVCDRAFRYPRSPAQPAAMPPRQPRCSRA